MRDGQFISMLLALGCFATAVVLSITLTGSFLMAIARTLRRVSPENRRMEPAMVWLNLIPVFNLVWCTVTVERVAESLRNEFRSREIDGPNESYGRPYGLTMLGLLASGVLFYPAFICYPIALVYWVLYWRQLNRYAKRLRPGAYVPPPVDEGW